LPERGEAAFEKPPFGFLLCQRQRAFKILRAQWQLMF
jgi:hypothetical protein